MPEFLYSTNTYMKFFLIENFRGGLHYVWVSEFCDSKMAPAYSSAALVPASSNPADLYRELKRDVECRDAHSAKITARKPHLNNWQLNGKALAKLLKRKRTI